MKQYQIDSMEFLLSKGRAILADEMGLGKTRTAIETTRKMGSRLTLVICPKFTFSVWEEELKKWYSDSQSIIYSGPPKVRKVKFNENNSYRLVPTFVITNIELAHELPTGIFDVVIIDEVHAKFRNKKTLAFKKANTILNSPRIKYKPKAIFLSGTPVINSAMDIWHYLRLLYPKVFTSYWRFAKEWCDIELTIWGNQVSYVRNPDKFKEFLREYLVRHTKANVAKQLPPKTRQAIYLELTPKQRKIYNQIANDIFVELEDSYLFMPNILSQITRLRQVLVTPRLLGFDVDGIALETFRELKKTTFENLVLFTSFKSALPFFPLDYRIDGSVPANRLAHIINDFGQPVNSLSKHVSLALGATVQTAKGYSLATASNAVVIGADWTTANMLQAEDRLHRMGQLNPVNIQYYIHKNTIEDRIFEVLDEKQSGITAILTKEDFYTGRR